MFKVMLEFYKIRMSARNIVNVTEGWSKYLSKLNQLNVGPNLYRAAF